MCVPGRSHRKFHALLHTENVLYPLAGRERIKAQEVKEQLSKGGQMRMASLRRCDRLRQLTQADGAGREGAKKKKLDENSHRFGGM